MPAQTASETSFDATDTLSALPSAAASSSSPFGEQQSLVETLVSKPDGSPIEASVVRRPRLRCNWKNCSYRAPDAESYQQHRRDHRVCPSPDCTWDAALSSKDIVRHVWRSHRIWAERTGYPPMSGTCNECGEFFERSDYIPRHKREVHRGNPRERKEGG